MTRPLDLDDFGATTVTFEPEEVPDVTQATSDQDDYENAFEAGYESGWEDCRKAQDASNESVSAALAQNIHDLHVTAEEVKSSLLQAIRPLLTSVFDRVLPQVADASLITIVEEQFLPMIERGSTLKYELIVAPSSISRIEALLDGSGLSVMVRSEETYSTNQIALKVGSECHELNLDRVMSEIRENLTQFGIR